LIVIDFFFELSDRVRRNISFPETNRLQEGLAAQNSLRGFELDAYCCLYALEPNDALMAFFAYDLLPWYR